MSKRKILLNWKGVETRKGLRNNQSVSQGYKITPTLRCSTVALCVNAGSALTPSRTVKLLLLVTQILLKSPADTEVP